MARGLAWLLVVALAGCSQPEAALPDPENDPLNGEIEAIRKLEADLAAAWAAHDADKIVSFYASDAFIQFPYRPVIDQIDAIRREIGTMTQDPQRAITRTPDTVEIARSGEIAWSRGSYRAVYSNPRQGGGVMEEGHFVNTYRKVNDGSWRIVADVATPSGPPRGPLPDRKTP